MGNAYAPAPAAVAAKSNANAPAAKKSKPAPDIDRGPFSPDKTIELMLRHAQATAEAALTDHGSAHKAKVLRAIETITEYLREVAVIARSAQVDWPALGERLTAIRETTDLLHGELSAGEAPLGLEMLSAFASVAALVPFGAWAASKAGSVKALTESESLSMSRQAISAARAHLATMPVLAAGADIRSELATFSAPLERHLQIAGDAALAVENRRSRLGLVPDVMRLSDAMEPLARTLAMKPRVEWDRSFASAFDAENELRRDVGLPVVSRPYAGRVDPHAALAQVDGAANGKAVDPSTIPVTDPAVAVQVLQWHVASVFNNQLSAVRTIDAALHEKDPPPRHGIADEILGALVNVALSTAAGAIGGLVSGLLKPRLEALNLRLEVSPAALGQLGQEARKMVEDDVLKRGLLTRTIVGDLLKDGAKEMFKSGIKATQNLLASRDAIAEPLTMFLDTHRIRLEDARGRAGELVLRLGPTLQQADLDQLIALVDSIKAVVDRAYDLQYGATMREWQNAKALMVAGPAPFENLISGGRDADLNEAGTPGVLDVVVDVSTVHAVELRSLRLNGAEPAARRHFKALAQRIDAIGLHRQFDVRFELCDRVLRFGVDPAGRLELETLDHGELAMLKVFSVGDPMSSVNVVAALNGGYSTVPDAAARTSAQGIVVSAGRFTTDKLEK